MAKHTARQNNLAAGTTSVKERLSSQQTSEETKKCLRLVAEHIFSKKTALQKCSVSKIYDIPQKNRRLRGNKGRLPKANEIAWTDEGDGSGSAQLEGSTFSYTRKDQI